MPGAVATPKVKQEDYVWVRAAATLAQGEVTLALSRVGGADTRAGAAVVDCVLLTTDEQYRPDYRDFNQQVYVRVRVERSSALKVPFVNRVTTGRQEHGPFSEPLGPGATSTWVNATRWFSGVDEARWNVVAGRPGTDLQYVVQFATAPDDARIAREIRVERPGRIVFLLPSEITQTNLPRADFELASERAREVASWPPITFGRRPTKFPILTNLDAESPGTPLEKPVLASLGLNGFTGLLTEADVRQGFLHSRVYYSAYHFLPAGHIVPDFPKLNKKLSENAMAVKASGSSDRVQHLKLIDEAGAMRLTQLAAHEENQRGFRRWLKERGFDPFSASDRKILASRGQTEADAVAIQTERDAEFPGLYYYSQRFRAYLVASAFGQLSNRVRAIYPKGVRSTQNLSDGAVVYANMYAQGNDYFEYFKNGNLDVAMSEDWTNGGATRQLCGWNVALLRSATKYRHQPIHMYDIAYMTRTPIEVKLKAMSSIAQGAKLLLMYDYAPRYVTETRGWAESPLIMAAISELSREIGAAEDVLIDAMPAPATTAILYSIAQDIWTVGHDIAQGNERQFTYLALRHAHVAVDVLSDDDVVAGLLDRYQTLYVHGEQLDRRVVSTLASWVRRGGSLVLSPGAASRDERNRPTEVLDERLGLRRRPLAVRERTLGSSFALRSWKGQAAEVTLGEGSKASALFVEQRFEQADGDESLARWEDGSSAALRRRVGKGRVSAFGFLPATEYVRRATLDYYDGHEKVEVPGYVGQIARRQGSSGPQPRIEIYGGTPPDYSANLRRLIVEQALRNRLEPVEVDQPLVEATLLEGSGGWVVPLANYGRAVRELALRVRPQKRCGPVQSAHLGELAASVEADGSVLLRLPLATTDFVFSPCTN